MEKRLHTHRLKDISANAISSETGLLRRTARSQIASAFLQARTTLVPDWDRQLSDAGTVNVGYVSRAIVVNDPAVIARLVVKVEGHQNIDIPSPVHSQVSFPYLAQQDTHYPFAHPAHTAKCNILADFVPLVLAEGTVVSHFPQVSLLEHTNY